MKKNDDPSNELLFLWVEKNTAVEFHRYPYRKTRVKFSFLTFNLSIDHSGLIDRSYFKKKLNLYQIIPYLELYPLSPGI